LGHTFNALYELLILASGDGLLPASGELLELLIRILDALILPHHSLHWLGEELVVNRKLSVKGLLVDGDPVQCLVKRVVGLQRVAESGTQVPQHCGVTEVTLEPRDGQLHGEVVEQRDRETQVALSIFKVDWVDLMGHS